MSEEESEVTQTTVEESHSPSAQSPESSVPDEPSSPNAVDSQATESRPRLAKQCMVDDESPLCIVVESTTEKDIKETVPDEIENTREVHEDISLVRSSLTSSRSDANVHDSATGRVKQLVRSHALCGDDDTRLRPPPESGAVRPQLSSKSLSRDSTATDYTDSSGVDLYSFIIATLHKNPKDRAMVLELEKQLIEFVNSEDRQSMRFPAMSSYNRMLIHRVSAFFGLDHNIDQTGQCIVVNRTSNTRCPEIPFSSLIQGNVFAESRGRFPRREVQSFDEVRDFSPSSRAGMDFCRRARSFEVSSGMGIPSIPATTTASYLSPRNQYVPQADVYIPSQTHSFDHDSGAIEWSDGRNGVGQKAGSFGGVPGSYADSTSFSNTADPSIPDDDVTRLSDITTRSQSMSMDKNIQPPTPLMSVRLPQSHYVTASAYADPTMVAIPSQYYPSIGELYASQYDQNQIDLMSQQLAAMSMQHSSSSSNSGYQNAQAMKQATYYPQVVPVPYQGSVYYAPQQQLYSNSMVYTPQGYSNAYQAMNQAYAYNQYQYQQSYPMNSVYQGQPAFQPYTPPMMNPSYNTPTNNYQAQTQNYQSSQTTLVNSHSGYHPALSHDAGYGSMTQDSIKESESFDQVEGHVAL